MGLAGMFISAVTGVAGAIMYFATNAQSSTAVQNHGFRLSTLGVILMIAGALGFLVSLAIFAASRRSVSDRSESIDVEVETTSRPSFSQDRQDHSRTA